MALLKMALLKMALVQKALQNFIFLKKAFLK